MSTKVRCYLHSMVVMGGGGIEYLFSIFVGENFVFPAPSAPRSFVVSRIDDSSDTLSATWMLPDPTNGVISGYTIDCVAQIPAMTELQFTADFPDTSTTLTELLPYTEYSCTIFATTGAGDGATTGPQVARTDEDGKAEMYPSQRPPLIDVRTPLYKGHFAGSQMYSLV